MEGEQHNNGPQGGNNVGGLIAEVENKMSELMAWHKSQVSQFEQEKAAFEEEMHLQREAINAEREQQEQAFKEKAEQQTRAIEQEREALADRVNEIEQQRVKLAGLANKLRAEESAMSREWGEVQREREALQQQADAIAKLREQTQERAKSWLDAAAAELNEPLKLTAELANENQATAQDQAEPDHEGHHQEAA